MKKFKIISLFLILFIFSSCTDDDWASFYEKSNKVSIEIETDLYSITDIEKSLADIVPNYTDLENLKLMYIKYNLVSLDEGTIFIQYSENYEKDDHGFTNTIDFYINIKERKIYKINCVDGLSKKVSSLSSNILSNKDINVKDVYKNYIERLKNTNINNFYSVEIIFCNKDIFYNCYNEKNQRINTTESEL